MKPVAFETKNIVVDPAFRTRHGEPDAKKVKQFLESMVSRHENDLPPQIQNGVVRPNPEHPDKPYLVDGEHRLLALTEFNKILHKAGEDPIPFYATVEQDKGDLEAIETGVRSNIRAELDLLDRSRSMALLNEKGKTLQEIAKMFDCSVGTVSDTINVGKLPKKILAKIESGTLQYEGAAVLSRYNKDPKLQEEILELASANRSAMDSIAERAEARAKAAEESKTDESGSTPAKKSAAKKTAAAKGKKPVKGKITAKDVKEAVAEKGAQKRTTADAPPTNRTYKQFVKVVEDKEWLKPLSQDARDLIGRIEAWFENDCEEKSLQNAFMKFCKGSASTAKAA